jgi:parallel beta-helix repeat protein
MLLWEEEKVNRSIALLSAIVVLSSGLGTADGTIWYVHPDSSLNSIQAGLDSCSTDDTVIVAPGTYYENLTWPSTQGIDLVSELGTDTTVIDGSGATYVIGIVTGVHSTTIVSGFTIMNGYGYEAGGIHCLSSSPTITGNTVTMNTADYGGAIECDMGSSPIITGNTITGNTGYSGGIECWRNSSPTISDNTITDNVAFSGGGIACYDICSPTIAGNTIDGNAAEWGGGLACYNGCSPEIRDNDISGNTADSSGGGIDCWTNSSPVIVGNTMTGNGAALGAGIACQNNCTPIIDSCVISHNNGDGIYCDTASSPVIHYNNIMDNIGYGVRNVEPGIIVDAEHNWWGHESGPYHSVTNPGGGGDTVSDYVDYDPWLPESVGVFETVLPTQEVHFVLFQNYPNPFTHATNIQWSAAKSCHTILKIYDASGRLVTALVDKDQEPGNYAVRWNGMDDENQEVATGFYFYHLAIRSIGKVHTDVAAWTDTETSAFTSTKKMVLLR